MNSSPTLTVADKLRFALEGLMRAVAACSNPRRPGGPLAAWLLMLIWTRVSRANQRIQRLLALFLAGRLRVAPAARQEARARGGQGTRRAVAEGKVPRSLAWLLPLVPC